jgi:hypothetical protein
VGADSALCGWSHNSVPLARNIWYTYQIFRARGTLSIVWVFVYAIRYIYLMAYSESFKEVYFSRGRKGGTRENVVYVIQFMGIEAKVEVKL